MGGASNRPNSGYVDWRVRQQQFMPLSVASAIAFHQAQRGTKAIESPQDYIAALDIAATALSRLIPVYVFDKASHARVAIDASPIAGQFTRGATEFRCRNGSTLTPLFVLRGDLGSALSFMRSVGPALAFAMKRTHEGAATDAEPANESERFDS